MAHSYNDGNSEPPVCDAITLAMHSTHVFPYLPNHRSSCFRHHQHQQREYWVSTSESATEPIASSKGASSSPCPVHFLGDAEGCHDDRKPAMCCIGWTRCENPDSSLNDTRLTVQCADRSSSLCCLLQSSQCALTKCHRHLLGNPRMTLADQEIVPVFDSIRCSYRRNSQDIEEASSVYHCLESRECETCIRGEPFFHSQRHICDFPHEQNDNGTRNNPDKRHQTQSHRRNCTRLFVGCSTGTLVDLGSHHSVSGPGMFARLTSGSFNRALSLSWIRNLFVYVIVLGILSQMCCEAGPIPRDGNKVYLSQGSLMYRKERSLLPHVQPSRRRRSSGVSPTTSAANDTSDPVHSSPRGSNSTSLFSSPISSDIPMETEPSPYPKSPEFLIPKDLEQEKLLALLVATLQRLNFLQDENSSGVSRCFLIVHNTSQQEDVKITSSRSDKVIEITISLSIHPSSLPGENGTSPGTNETSGGESAVLPTFCLDNTFVEISLGKEKKKGGGAATAATSATHNTGADGKKGTGGIYGVLHSGRLSRTQIVVISTCSAIIGMFFLIAAFLRIRNYIKRIRLEQAQANRPKFRSCSVALRNPTHSMEQLRRDSLASKASHQNSVTTKGSNYSHTNASSREEDSSASSPRHDPDTTPLLVITRAPQGGGDSGNPSPGASAASGESGRGGANGGPPGPSQHPSIRRLGTLDTPTQSNSSLQYTEEDRAIPRKKVTFDRSRHPRTS